MTHKTGAWMLHVLNRVLDLASGCVRAMASSSFCVHGGAEGVVGLDWLITLAFITPRRAKLTIDRSKPRSMDVGASLNGHSSILHRSQPGVSQDRPAEEDTTVLIIDVHLGEFIDGRPGLVTVGPSQDTEASTSGALTRTATIDPVCAPRSVEQATGSRSLPGGGLIMAEADVAGAGTKPISKREQKRQEKLARQQAEAASITTTAATDAGSGDVASGDGTILPIVDDTTKNSAPVTGGAEGDAEAGADKVAESRKPVYVEPIQKRIRVLLKKKTKIDKLEELVQDPEEAKKLNEDQREILKRKDQVLAPLKELQQLSEQLQELEVEEVRFRHSSETARSSEQARALAEAKKQGREEGRQVLSTLVSFLHHASVLRENPSSDTQLNEASERLLTLVYTAGETSVEAAERLAQESEELVDGTEVSYKQVADALKPQPEPAAAETAPEEPDSLRTPSDQPEGTTGLKGSNFLSIDDVLNNPTPIGHGGISFLNESEIEGVHAPDEPAVASAIGDDNNGGASSTIVQLETTVGGEESTGTESAPAQTIAEPAKVAVDWKAAATGSWADDDFEAAESADGAGEAAAAATTVPAVPEVTPAGDDFKQVGGRRGGGRGGQTGRGRGRGGDPRRQPSDRPPRSNGQDGRQRSNRTNGTGAGDGAANGRTDGRRNGQQAPRRDGTRPQQQQRQPSGRQPAQEA